MSSVIWPIPEGRENAPIEAFHQITPIEVLFYYDGPLIYTAKLDGKLVLCYWSDEDDEVERWVYSAITEDTLQALQDNKVTLCQALDGSPIWAADIYMRDGICKSAWRLESLEDVPADAKPDESVYLSL